MKDVSDEERRPDAVMSIATGSPAVGGMMGGDCVVLLLVPVWLYRSAIVCLGPYIPDDAACVRKGWGTDGVWVPSKAGNKTVASSRVSPPIGNEMSPAEWWYPMGLPLIANW